MLRAAPSYAPPPQQHHLSPVEIGRRFLARFGDRRYVHSLTFRPAPTAATIDLPGLYAQGRPPADALDVVIHAPLANERGSGRRVSEKQRLDFQIANWELYPFLHG